MKKINVKAVAGAKVPFEDNARRYITEQAEVVSSPYYRRAIHDGDLALVPDATAKTKKKD